MDYFRISMPLFAAMNLTHRIGSWIYPDFLWSGSRDQKVVYLTFDDGPHPEITPWVLEKLDEVNAKATFFMVGDNVNRYPETVSAVRQAGHSIGNHTQNHLNGWKSGKDDYIRNIEECAELLQGSELFRPPYGKIQPFAISSLKNLNVVMWDILSKDYKHGIDCNKQLNYMKELTQNGSIVVFHDSVKAKLNLEKLLPPYLHFLKEEGYVMQAL